MLSAHSVTCPAMSTITVEAPEAEPDVAGRSEEPRRRRRQKAESRRYPVSPSHRALASPIRMRMLMEFGDDAMSPKMLADALGEPLGNISYHVKSLEAGGLIELAQTVPRRGALEHFYRRVVGADRVLPTLYLPAPAAERFNEELADLVARAREMEVPADEADARVMCVSHTETLTSTRGSSPRIETLHCQAGNHDYEREKRPGRKPPNCPKHR